MVIFVTVVYGKNRKEEREDLWNELMMIKRGIGETLMLIMGYFNESRFPEDKEGQGTFDIDCEEIQPDHRKN